MMGEGSGIVSKICIRRRMVTYGIDLVPGFGYLFLSYFSLFNLDSFIFIFICH